MKFYIKLDKNMACTSCAYNHCSCDFRLRMDKDYKTIKTYICNKINEKTN